MYIVLLWVKYSLADTLFESLIPSLFKRWYIVPTLFLFLLFDIDLSVLATTPFPILSIFYLIFFCFSSFLHVLPGFHHFSSHFLPQLGPASKQLVTLLGYVPLLHLYLCFMTVKSHRIVSLWNFACYICCFLCCQCT